MPDNNLVANHYTQGSLLEAFREGIKRLGKTVDNVTVQDLGPAVISYWGASSHQEFTGPNSTLLAGIMFWMSDAVSEAAAGSRRKNMVVV